MNDVEGFFKKLRHDDRHHLALGDVRITLAQQEDLAHKFEMLRKWIDGTGAQYDICTMDILGKTCDNCRCGKMDLDEHKIIPSDDKQTITVLDEPGNGGANNTYDIECREFVPTHLRFQPGQICADGGIMHDTLMFCATARAGFRKEMK